MFSPQGCYAERDMKISRFSTNTSLYFVNEIETYSYNGILIGTYTRSTQWCNFERHGG